MSNEKGRPTTITDDSNYGSNKEENLMNRLIEICEQVAIDVENDVTEFEGKPFNGKTVATIYGYQAAAIKALADVLKEVIKNTYSNAVTTVITEYP